MSKAPAGDKFTWEHAVADSDLPAYSKLVLFALSLRMDKMGGSCFPTTLQLAAMTSLSENTVIKYRDEAIKSGFLTMSKMGFKGQKWKRAQYVAAFPKTSIEGHSNSEGTSHGEVACMDKAPHGVRHVANEGTSHGEVKAPHGVRQDKEQTNNQTNREREATAALADDLRSRVVRFLNGETFTSGEWTGWQSSSLKWIIEQFTNLSETDRQSAERWRDAYLRQCHEKRIKPVAAGNYFNGYAWEGISSAMMINQLNGITPSVSNSSAQKSSALFAPMSAGWNACRMKIILEGPSGTGCDADSDLSAVEREWPDLSKLHKTLKQARAVSLGGRYRELEAAMEPVDISDQLHQEWLTIHRARGWPLAPMGGYERSYYPIAIRSPDGTIDVDATLNAFGEALDNATHKSSGAMA